MKHSYRKFAVLGMLALLALAPTLRAEEADNSSATADDQEEMRATLGNLTAQMNDLKKWADEIPKVSVNVDLRYDNQVYKAGTINASPTSPILFQTAAAPNGAIGMYAKRVELEVSDKISSWAKWDLQYEFAGDKLEDLGIEMNGLSMLPLVDTGSYRMDVKVGLFRQPFGIEEQTGSSSIPFPERALIYGGANPFNSYWSISKTVAERVMGIQVKQVKDFGPFAYSLAAAVANDETDTNAGTTGNTLSTTQALDPDPSEMGRVGIDLKSFGGLTKDILALQFGASALHDSEDQAFMTKDPTKQFSADVVGWDSTLDVFKNWHFIGEWVARNEFAGSLNGVVGGPSGLVSREEGWYITSVMEPLKWFDKDAPKIEWNTRYEGVVTLVDQIGQSNTWARSDNAITTGIKWSYVGKTYTSINYTVYGLGNNFGALAGTELWTIQQQFNY